MKIQLREVTIRELVKDYQDDGDGGVTGYGGKLDIRPPFQREFIYKDKQRDAVIRTIQRGFPLNVMYWAARDHGTFEVIDGQQRTISIAQFVAGDGAGHGGFPVDKMFFENLPGDRQARILDYPLMVYVCEGTDSEKLDWFETINIAGAELKRQELRNAVYAGPWLTDAKKRFSRRGCPAYGIGQDYMKGSPIRQDYLETAIQWISGGDIERYMGENQYTPSAVKLWDYFQSVMTWVEAIFTVKRPGMKGVDWGPLYDEHKGRDLDPAVIEAETARLVMDDEVINQAGIYRYILTRQEKHLNLRQFSKAVKQAQFERQGGVCAICKATFGLQDMEGDHITPWAEGGHTEPKNCQMLCRECNRRKGKK